MEKPTSVNTNRLSALPRPVSKLPLPRPKAIEIKQQDDEVVREVEPPLPSPAKRQLPVPRSIRPPSKVSAPLPPPKTGPPASTGASKIVSPKKIPGLTKPAGADENTSVVRRANVAAKRTSRIISPGSLSGIQQTPRKISPPPIATVPEERPKSQRKRGSLSSSQQSPPSLADRTRETIAQLPPTPRTGGRRRSSFFSPPESPSQVLPKSPSRAATFNVGTSTSYSSSRPTSSGSSANANPSPVESTSSATMGHTSRRSVSTTAAANFKQPARGVRFPVRTASANFGNGGGGWQPQRSPVLPPEVTSPRSTGPNSSAALREQIRAAKAGQSTNKLRPLSIINGLDFNSITDPFNQQARSGNSLLRTRLDLARMDGQLNIAGLNLRQMPPEVMSMYDYDPNNVNSPSWSEMVDLKKFIAADNLFEVIGDDVFPDVDKEVAAESEELKGLQFAGVETLDLHGNLLHTIPMGLRQLELLTVLNLSHNRLDTTVFDVLEHVTSLRELRLGDNLFAGVLPSSIARLEQLETLDLRDNRLLSLPDEIGTLSRLRYLNLNSNKLSEVPLAAFRGLSLRDLDISKNALAGAWCPAEITALPTLQYLNLSGNALTSLDSGALSLSGLKHLDITANRITSLPDISTWTSLTTLLAEDNGLSSLPEGFTRLTECLRAVDFTGNNLRTLEPEIGFMENLESLRVGSNPLRDRRFLTMDTTSIKEALQMRAEAPAHVEPVS